MTEKEMIEEMAKLLTGCCERLDEKGQPIGFECLSGCEYYDNENSNCTSFNKKQAKTLYQAKYRKIPEGAVVIPEKITEETRPKELIKIAKYNDAIRKETARGILQSLLRVIRDNEKYGIRFVVVYAKDLQELAKQFGVEVE